MKKIVLVFAFLSLGFTTLFANVSEKQCMQQGDDFIYAGGECIQFYEAEGDVEGSLNIIVHGTWPAGTNTLARYGTFADNLVMNTDITTVAVALPGYSKSSTNNFEALAHKGVKNLSSHKNYIVFLEKLVIALKEKYDAQKVNYIGHSAGGRIGATLAGYSPDLLTTVTVAGGSFTLDADEQGDKFVALSTYIDKVKDTKFLLVYGSVDKISKPEVTKEFYKLAQAKGFDVSIVEAKGAPHLDLDMTDASVEAITEMVAEEE